MKLLLFGSILFQLTVGILAIKLIRITGRYIAGTNFRDHWNRHSRNGIFPWLVTTFYEVPVRNYLNRKRTEKLKRA